MSNRRGNPQNLKPCKPGETHNPNGRPKRLSNVIESIPQDAKERVYEILFKALSFNNTADAMRYIESQDTTDFKYGFVLQLAVKTLTGKNSWQAVNDILDRLFGKATQSAKIEAKGEMPIVIVRTDDEKRKLERIGDLG